MNHTSSPWNALEAIANMKINETTNHAELLALCIAIAKAALVGEGDGYACLIAAAPELLMSCRDSLDLLEKCAVTTAEGIPFNTAAYLGEFRAAIAKAEGK